MCKLVWHQQMAITFPLSKHCLLRSFETKDISSKYHQPPISRPPLASLTKTHKFDMPLKIKISYV